MSAYALGNTSLPTDLKIITSMSSAFLKNETVDAPVVVPARAPLPPGTTNYVTPCGLSLLRDELTELEVEHARVQTDIVEENERMRQLALLNGQIGNLNQRIASARVVDPRLQPHNEIRFGATVALRTLTGKKSSEERQFTIVGVDETDASHGRIAFTAPIARVIQGKCVGETVRLRTIRGEDVMEITAITYG